MNSPKAIFISLYGKIFLSFLYFAAQGQTKYFCNNDIVSIVVTLFFYIFMPILVATHMLIVGGEVVDFTWITFTLFFFLGYSI